MPSARWSRWAVTGLAMLALALAGCKNQGGNAVATDPAEPPPPVTDTTTPPTDNGPWTWEDASTLIAEAAADAAKDATGNRFAVIDAAVAAAVDQAMLVAPDLGASAEWAEAIRTEISRGVIPTEVPGQPSPVLQDFIREHVKSRTLDWLRTH